MNHVDLDRDFFPVGRDEPDLEFGSFWGRKIGGWLTWGDLLSRRRVVLLGEASSGKTDEFREQSAVLRRDGQAAFSVPIEQLAELGLERTIGSSAWTLFERWKTGSSDGWFFLDSVDEARLNRKSFELALSSLSRDLGVEGLARAHVLISCRVSDWRTDQDRRSIESSLPIPPTVAPPEEPSSQEAALLGPIFERAAESNEKSGAASSRDTLLIVRLVGLSDRQKRALAVEAGIADATEFVDAINRAGLDPLADRPGDLLDLAEYWKTNGRLGGFAEMTEHGVNRRLQEIEKYRADNDALSQQKAREGAERLAAALTLVKSVTLRAPGCDPDPLLAGGAIDPTTVLEDWNDAERNALLRRGVFAPSTYGRIRFHHRSTQEYLTAGWINRLARDRLSRGEVFRLLFGDRYGVETVVPSLRAAAAWLALRDTEIRDEIVRREPLVLVNHGDPASLPLEVRSRLLDVVATKHHSGEIADDSLDDRALWMFADPSLAGAIRTAWSLNARADFHFVLLRLIREGRIAACSDLARAIALSDTASDYNKIVAVQALEVCDDQEGLSLTAGSFLDDAENLSARFAPAVAKVLFPRHLSVTRLLEMIDKSHPAKEYTVSGFGYALAELWESCPSTAARDEFVNGVADLCLRPPYVTEYMRISQRHQELAKRVSPTARRAVLALGERHPPTSLVRLLMTVERAEAESASPMEEDQPRLHVLVRANAKIHRALFWSDVADERRHRSDDDLLIRHWQIHGVGATLWELSEADLPWLYDDLMGRAAEADHRIALSAIVDVLRRQDRLDAEAASLRGRVAADPLLSQDLEGYLAPRADTESDRRRREQQERFERERRERQDREKESWIRFGAEVRQDPALLSDPGELVQWRGAARLLDLRTWLERRTKDHGKDAVIQWRLLGEAFGPRVAEAFRDGMKLLWRLVEPERPTRTRGATTSVKWTTVLSFEGLTIEAAESTSWASNFSNAEAERAALHGCMAEQGYPAWIDNLADAHPDSVVPVIADTLRREWSSSRAPTTYFLDRYANPTAPIHRLIKPRLYAIVTGPEPRNLYRLDRGLEVLQRLELDDRSRTHLVTLAVRRFHRHNASGSTDPALRYLALLFSLVAARAGDLLTSWIRTTSSKGRTALAEQAFAALFGETDPLVGDALERAPVDVLEQLVLLAYETVRPEDDTTHDGPYSPDTRDRAANGRSRILRALANSSGPNAFEAMLRLADHPALTAMAHRLRELARGIAERDAEIASWTVADVHIFEKDHVAPAKTGADLLRLTLAVIDDIRFDFSKGDASARRLVETAADEDAIQRWLAGEVRVRTRGRLGAHRETEVADRKRPDLTVTSSSAPFELAIEVKRADEWSVRQLEAALRNQLAEDYLRPEYRRHGIFVVTHHRKRSWRHPLTREVMSFAALVTYLDSIATRLTRNSVGLIQVRVKGIDASAN